ncbi:MAG TPA: hypothetical protein VGO94_03490 [Mycobacteriales bacterium]|jgi:hypothetical protein|nr:hypothetical protein [Mycobacteriales bacterium]
MTSNYPPPPPPPGDPGMTGAPTEQRNRPPYPSAPPGRDPLSVTRPQRPAAAGSDGWRTTEFGVFLLVALGNLLAAALVNSGGGRDDHFRADRAWFYITLLAIAYLLSRGIAKIGGPRA